MKLFAILNIGIGIVVGMSGYWAGLVNLTVGCIILAIDVLASDDDEEEEIESC